PLPRERVRSRNSYVMTAHTAWNPRSAPDVRQYPSRKNPGTGSKEHGSSSPPRTFTTPSLRRPAGDEPAAAPEARRHQRQPDKDQEDERRPHPADTPVAGERSEEDRHADGERGDHRAGEEGSVARADEDAVEREHGSVQRLHQSEDRPQERDLVKHVVVPREHPREDTCEREHDDRERRAERDREPDHPLARR